MDLSNLRNSLREDEASTLRRTRHLRSSEDELSAVFRSAATSLTTLYRQGVASNKASYEKGYAHALAHVLELWGRDKDWLKGYLQRRIEALEVEGEEEMEEARVPQEPEEIVSPVRTREVSQASRLAERGARESPRQSNKRSRSGFGSSQRGEDESETGERRLHRIPTSSRSSNQASSSAFSTNFNFSAPISYPSVTKPAPTHDASRSTSKPTTTSSIASGGVIKTSSPASSRRRLQRLKGLRAGRDRIIEVERAQDDMVDEGEEDDADAWTDDEDQAKKSVVWADKSSSVSTAGNGQGMEVETEARVLERTDRRKRRKSNRIKDAGDEDEAELSGRLGEEDVFAYHS